MGMTRDVALNLLGLPKDARPSQIALAYREQLEELSLKQTQAESPDLKERYQRRIDGLEEALLVVLSNPDEREINFQNEMTHSNTPSTHMHEELNTERTDQEAPVIPTNPPQEIQEHQPLHQNPPLVCKKAKVTYSNPSS